MKRRRWLALPALLATAAAARGQGGAVPPAGPAAEGDAPGLQPRPLRFPRDHGAHPGTRTEWWYLTGWLAAGGTLRYGFQATFFRSRNDDIAPTQPSRFAARQLLFAHAALSDLAGGRLHHDQRIARAGFGVAEASTADTALRLRDWWLQRTADGAVLARYQLALDSERAGFALALQARTTQPLLLQGAQGWSRKGPLPTQASHYYSQPQLAVNGSVRLGGRSLQVEGRAWLDHEWSETLLAPEAVGWDWIGINLDDGGALTAFRLRRRDGSALWSGGSLRTAAGALRVFEGVDALRFTPLRRWTSPATGTAYPVHWRIDTPAGSYEVRALLDAQELDARASTGNVYWEGLSELRAAGTSDGTSDGTSNGISDGTSNRTSDGTSNRTSDGTSNGGGRLGLGYLEMTGYAATLRL